MSLSNLTAVFCHYGKDRFNHRLRFGVPQALVKLDSYRKIAVFKPGAIFGYIRWMADEYGTQDWRFYILESQNGGLIPPIPGVRPGAKILFSAQGKSRVQRCLSHIDHLEAMAKTGLESLPASYWRVIETALIKDAPLRHMPHHYLAEAPRHDH